MNGKRRRLAAYICFLVILGVCFYTMSKKAPHPAFQGEWRCVALGATHLVLTGDYSQLEQRLFKKQTSGVNRVVSFWSKDAKYRYAAVKTIASYRPEVVKMLRDKPSIQIEADAGKLSLVQTGYWLNPIGQSRFLDKNGQEHLAQCAEVAHYLFLTLSRPLSEGETVSLVLPAGEKLTFTYSVSMPTPMFKINQVGYMPFSRKYAYLGAWLGTAGPMSLHEKYDGKPFRLIDAANGQVAFTGELHKRMQDPTTDKGTPYTGEEVLELDFSSWQISGSYYVAVEGIGRSEEFRISDSTMAEAFYVHARGLFHQRCGIAKEEPYTHWSLKKCHPFCYRGTFPPHDGHYGKSKDNSRPYGFRDSEGNSISVSHFKLIKENAPTPPEKLELCGGWHDAADWDRRPHHLGIVGDLAAVYLLKPQNYIDGQLNIPESGNGIPDILDEALWGIDYLRKSQLPDGGVGTWIETTRHPGYPELSSADTLVYYISCATRNSTLEYAAYAAELALALKKSGADTLAELFRDSATQAWDYAQDEKNAKIRTYRYDDQLITYCEDPKLEAEYVVKAGVDLYQLWKEKKYILAAESAIKEALKAMHKGDWAWSPLIWIELELFPLDSSELEKLRDIRGKRIVKEAKNMLRQQEEAYPIRLNWRGPREAWVHTTSWGTYHPLRRARTFIVAHAITGESKCLDGACLANDFNNGANPTGTSMTSGLGRVYPVKFLHLDSYADGTAEFVPGITPYRNTYGIPRAAIDMAFGMYYHARPHHLFKEIKESFLPCSGLTEEECAKEMNLKWPIWRRWGNVESLTVAASEFTVYETIAPAMAVTGYLLNGPQLPEKEWLERRPASNIRLLPGYAPLP